MSGHIFEAALAASHGRAANLIWGNLCQCGTPLPSFSACDGRRFNDAVLLAPDGLLRLFAAAAPSPITLAEVAEFAPRLHQQLLAAAPRLREAMLHETGFSQRDCAEMLEGCLAYVAQFVEELERCAAPPPVLLHYEDGARRRCLRQVRVPWGTVAVVLPQNAFLLIALTCTLNALACGNRVVLRAPKQSPFSARLLAELLLAADVPRQTVSLVLCESHPFVDALCAVPGSGLLHFLGGSEPLPLIWPKTFAAGKAMLGDGAGNVWVYVDEGSDPAEAARILAQGSTRYNGQTCTSINGAMVHPSLYDALREALRAEMAALKIGNPAAESVDVGPLFDPKSALLLAEYCASSGGQILLGGPTESDNLVAPTLVEKPTPDSDLVCAGVFAPALWLDCGTREEFVARWPQNRFPLCAGVLAPRAAANQQSWWLANLPNVARLVWNGDPSVEHIFEPWGGYAPAGANPVGLWQEKYTRVVSVDEVCG